MGLGKKFTYRSSWGKRSWRAGDFRAPAGGPSWQRQEGDRGVLHTWQGFLENLCITLMGRRGMRVHRGSVLSLQP